METHIENRLRLFNRKAEACNQLLTRFVTGPRATDECDDFIEVIECDAKSFENMRSCLCFVEVELGPATNDFFLMLDIVINRLLNVQCLWSSSDEREHVNTERRLHRCLFVQVVQNDTRIRVAADFDDDAHPVSIRLVSKIRDAFDFLIAHQVGNLLDQPGFVHLIRNLVDENAFPSIFQHFNLGFRTHRNRAATCLISTTNAAPT